MKYSALFGSSVKCFIQPFTAVDLMGGELAQVDPGVKGGVGGRCCINSSWIIYCASSTALVLLRWFYCAGSTALVLLCWFHCTGFTALVLLHWFHCTGSTALVPLRWFHCAGSTALVLLCWFYCTGSTEHSFCGTVVEKLRSSLVYEFMSRSSTGSC